MKILVMTSQKRLERYSDRTSIPKEWELIFTSPGSSDDQILSAGKDADVIFTDPILNVSRNLIEQMPNLKLIHSEGVGFNRIDIDAAKAAGVFVCNNAGVNSGAVAEHAVMMMMALLRRLSQGDAMVREGRQIQAKESFIMNGIRELGSCRVGLVGFGAIAKATAGVLGAFGCELIYFSRTRSDNGNDLNIKYAPLDEMIPECDIISLHVPVTPETTHLVNSSFLSRMKPTAILINTARGEIVDQEALAAAITENRIAGAGLDTLDPEPVTLDNPLLRLPEECRFRVLFSPHTAGTTEEVFRRAHRNVWKNIIAVASKKRPVNIVNGL